MLFHKQTVWNWRLYFYSNHNLTLYLTLLIVSIITLFQFSIIMINTELISYWKYRKTKKVLCSTRCFKEDVQFDGRSYKCNLLLNIFFAQFRNKCIASWQIFYWGILIEVAYLRRQYLYNISIKQWFETHECINTVF